jgi:putative phosphoesterase
VRVAALYDVHGNLPALDAVLAEVEREDVEEIVSGGDVVWGPFPGETLRRLEEVATHLVLGNADRDTVGGEPSEPSRWCRDRLTASERTRVAAWPATARLELAGLGRVLFCHGTPRSDVEGVTEVTPEEVVADAFADVNADVVVCGHTHHQFDRHIAGVRVVNAGSVGLPYEGRRGAFWALLGPDVELRRTEYDVSDAVRRIRATGYPDADELAGWLLDPEDPAEVSAYFESQRA